MSLNKYGVQEQNMDQFFLTFFLVWLVQFLKKKKTGDKSKFSWLVLLFKHIFIKIQPNMSKQKKKKKKKRNDI